MKIKRKKLLAAIEIENFNRAGNFEVGKYSIAIIEEIRDKLGEAFNRPNQKIPLKEMASAEKAIKAFINKWLSINS